jgi:cyclophilin family peptidyl-prolyl cis-trans isomerase
MNSTVTLLSLMFSILIPQRSWYPPSAPLMFSVKADKDAVLELTDFSGKVLAPGGSASVKAGEAVDVKNIFPEAAAPGTYVLYALPDASAASKSGPPANFLGTPVVIEVLADPSAQSAMVTHVIPLQYALMTTEAGPITEIFYYDSAPHTVDNFLGLSQGGYYDGIVFHRVVPGFVIQGGDPTGTGMGGPGYQVNSEFNNKPHNQGVLSMARSQDPNSAGSQFFICLDYAQTQQLDGKYTAFGIVTKGMDTVNTIAGGKLADPQKGAPEKPVAITSVEVKPVTAKDDPYTTLFTPAK